jgi:hypothetical protein
MDSIKQMMEKAKMAEEADIDSAIAEYENIIKSDQLNEHAYNRLMILFRKKKDLKKELSLINSGIREYEKFYKTKARISKKVNELSDKLKKAVGLVDRKGQNLYDPEPIATWKKRKAMLEKRKK